MNWLRSNWLNIAVVLAIAGAISGWVSSARWRGVADAEAAQVERLESEVQRAADSVSAARARARAATERAEAQRAAHDSTIARLNARLSTLRSQATELEAAAEAELQDNDGWLSRETHEAVVANLERTIVATDSARAEAKALAQAERARGDALEVQVGALAAQVGSLEEVNATQAREIQALREADSAGGFLPDFGAVTKPIYVIGGAVVGYLIAEAR